jgi:biotin operon repressor
MSEGLATQVSDKVAALRRIGVDTHSEEQPLLRQALQTGVDLSTPELVTATGLSRSAIVQQLNAFINEGLVEATAPPRSPRRRYRWLGYAATSER